MRTPRTMTFPARPKPSGTDPERYRRELDRYLAEMERMIADLVVRLHGDLSEGETRFQVVTSTPAATELDEGQIILVNSTPDALTTKIDGTVRRVELA